MHKYRENSHGGQTKEGGGVKGKKRRLKNYQKRKDES